MDKKSVGIIKKFILKLKKDFAVSKVIFFGSRAANDYLNDSDIDLLIVSPDFKGIDMSGRMSLMYRYWDNRYDVDFLCYTPEEFRKLSKMITIAREAARKGIVIE